MTESEVKTAELSTEATTTAPQQSNYSNILRPTLHDNDFLQSFVRIGLDDGGSDARHTTFADEKYKRYINII